MSMKTWIMLVLIILLTAGCGRREKEKSGPMTYVTIGTGGVTGVYYPTGGAISKIVNQKSDIYNLNLSAESTGGSVYNINAIMNGDMAFGIVQSDRQAQAYGGEAEWEDAGPQEKLRSVFSIHPETVTILAAVDAGIENINDLVGKTVNIGNPGSGNRGNAIDALENAGMDWRIDLKAEGMKATEASRMLQEGRIDAFFYTVGHPSSSFREATSGRRKVRFIPITAVEDLLDKYSYYARSWIPIEFYPNADNKENVPSYGVKATLCISSDIPEEIVYAVTREIFENFEEFKTLHPAYGILTKENMLEGLTAPIHSGAMKYYIEAGLK
ncbi:MAG: TAXI family TRAP transporter solute-binding subunit [Spirochaetales bacterium]|nr:TAXI family TRAP transporter solute-binding subunit [Spirochaetales bacterium]